MKRLGLIGLADHTLFLLAVVLFCSMSVGCASFSDETEAGSQRITYYPNGVVRKIYTVDSTGKPHGRQLAFFESGDLQYECFWQHGSQTGTVLHYYPNGNRDTEVSLLNGDVVRIESWFPSGARKQELDYISGSTTQKFRAWYESGAKRCEGHMIDGDMWGEWLEWHENGQLRGKGRYKDNKKQKGYEEFNEDGSILKVWDTDEK